MSRGTVQFHAFFMVKNAEESFILVFNQERGAKLESATSENGAIGIMFQMV